MNELSIQALHVGQHQQLFDGRVVAHVAIKRGVGIAPLLCGEAEQGHVQQVGFVGVGDGSLRRRDLRRDQVLLDRIGVDAVIDLG